MQSARDTANINLTATLESNVLVFRGIFAKDAILRIRRVTSKSGIAFGLLYFDGMVNTDIINESVIKPLIQLSEEAWENRAAFISERVLFSSEVKICFNRS